MSRLSAGLVSQTWCQLTCRSKLHQTSVYLAGAKWRMKRGEAPCGNEYGPLVDIPDWSYADGRPAPLGKMEVKRREESRALGERAVKLMDEMNFAKQNYQSKQRQFTERQRNLSKPKLKPKS